MQLLLFMFEVIPNQKNICFDLFTDGALFLSNVVVGTGCDTQATAQYFCLETIVEETSDDLRSESSLSSVCSGCSSNSGDEDHCGSGRYNRSPSDRHHRWLATDSDSGSVIHVPDRCDCDACSDDGGNEAVDDRTCFCSCNLNGLYLYLSTLIIFTFLS